MRIFLNPGHCIGVDSGAVNHDTGVTEAMTVGEIGLLVKKYLEDAGEQCLMLQSNNMYDEDPSWPSICQSANKWPADIFISLHCNDATNRNAEGCECWVYSLGGKAADLAECINNQIADSLNLFNRGVKESKRLCVLKRTKMPAVLVELGFINNDDDFFKLQNNKDEFARAIARGITDYLEA